MSPELPSKTTQPSSSDICEILLPENVAVSIDKARSVKVRVTK